MLDGVCSPITRRVYNLGLDQFIAWFTEASRRIRQGDRHRQAQTLPRVYVTLAPPKASTGLVLVVSALYLLWCK